MDSQRGAKDANLSLRCIKDKLLPIAGTVLVAALLIAVIALAAPSASFQPRNAPRAPPAPQPPPTSRAAPTMGSGLGCSASTSWRTRQTGMGGSASVCPAERNWPPWRPRRSCTGLGCAGIARGRGCGPMGLSSITRSALRAAGAAPTRTAEGSAALSAPAPNVPSAAAPNGGGRSSEPTPGRRRGALGGGPTTKGRNVAVLPVCPSRRALLPAPPPILGFLSLPCKKKNGFEKDRIGRSAVRKGQETPLKLSPFFLL
ncbi:translation initiation factor IF-2-like isoform X9 [Gallus gallus]|uniref:translation initiation factor IF-2-like isoform X9 n=1 Tax=Gallus gallus TaxID=9031 RepID=UPI001F00305E|nr:translation initiation factor IF-2-like isoform X9 [Gallus gallus]